MKYTSRYIASFILAAMAFMGVLLMPTYGFAEVAEYSLTPVPPAEVPAQVESVLPAVVSIVSSKNVTQTETIYSFPNMDINGTAVAPVTQSTTTVPMVTGVGSGFIGTSDGQVLTAEHVVDDPSADYSVIFSDGTLKPATVTYRDTAREVALLKIDGTYPDVAHLGDSATTKTGDAVTAIGTAFGEFEQTISNGAVDAFDQTVYADKNGTTEKLSGLVETTAPVVPGYSGGPVIDSTGAVIGVNVAANLTSGRGYFIPINTVKESLRNAQR